MKIDKIATDDDLIDFLLDQHKQTCNQKFMTVVHTLERYRRCHEIFSWQLSRHEWNSVNDKQRQPPVREEVIVAVCDDSGDSPFKYTASGWLTERNGMWIVDNDVCPYVTHWMPLPKPPKKE